MNGDPPKRLQIWEAGMEIVAMVYRLTEGFPSHEPYGLTGQNRRSALSIPQILLLKGLRGKPKKGLCRFSIIPRDR